MVVVTGLSGSGKSSLAFDTIYAEGQRRYVESLSAYARQFLGPDGQARRRPHRRSLACGLHRPEDHVQQPPLHGRYGNGDLRLPASALRPRRAAALPRLRLPRRLLDAAADGREGPHPPREDALYGACARGAGAQGRVREDVQGAGRERLRPRQGRRRAARAARRPRAGQELQARHRGRRRQAGDQGRHRAPPHGLHRDRPASGRRPGAGRDRRA